MGFVLLQENMQFIPRNFGIKNNTAVTAFCVGGGGGGSQGSGKGGKAGQGTHLAYNAGGGGGGGGFGAGGGGNGGYDDSPTLDAETGGGAGQLKIATFAITNNTTPIPVHVAQKVGPRTKGDYSSFGSYVRAEGGAPGGAPTFSPVDGGQGGEGGFQLGLFYHGGLKGAGGDSKGYSATGTSGGGGAGNRHGHAESAGGSGSGGGGDGGNSGSSGEDGYTYLHSGGNNSGCILLFW